MYKLAGLGYILICKVKENKKCSFENANEEKSESSIINKKWLSGRIGFIFNS